MKSESEVTQSCSTLSNPVDGNLSGSSVLGIFQARVVAWGATAFSREGPQTEANGSLDLERFLRSLDDREAA